MFKSICPTKGIDRLPLAHSVCDSCGHVVLLTTMFDVVGDDDEDTDTYTICAECAGEQKTTV